MTAGLAAARAAGVAALAAIGATATEVACDIRDPAAVAAAVKTPPEARSKEQLAALDRYQSENDEKFVKQRDALWTARLPLPVDAKLAELKAPPSPRMLSVGNAKENPAMVRAVFDALRTEWRSIRVPRDPQCSVCGAAT